MTDTKPLATITSQVEATDKGSDGNLTNGYRVGFQTAKGVNATVFVPRAGYSADAVMAAVKAHALQLDALQGASVS